MLSALLAATKGLPCFNSSYCPYPEICIISSDLRRYCTSSIDDLDAGRTLFQPAELSYSCTSCEAPLALIDFGSPPDAGVYECASSCTLLNNSSARDAVVESYEMRNCGTACKLSPLELTGSARFSTSPHFPGWEPTVHLTHIRAVAAAAVAAAQAAEAEAVRLAVAANESATGLESERTALEALRRTAALMAAQLDEATVHAARMQARVDGSGGRGPLASEKREVESALEEAVAQRTMAARAMADAAAAVDAMVASAPLPFERDAFAPEAEAAAALVAARKARARAADAEEAARQSGLLRVPLAAAVRVQWGSDAWGHKDGPGAAGGILKLTEATDGMETGGAVLRPGRELLAWDLEMDLLIDGGSGGDGFTVSYGAVRPGGLRSAAVPPAHGVSLMLRTQPTHAAEVWLDGGLLVRRDFPGCPVADSSYSVSCVSWNQTGPKARLSWNRTGGPPQLEPNRRPASAGIEMPLLHPLPIRLCPPVGGAILRVGSRMALRVSFRSCILVDPNLRRIVNAPGDPSLRILVRGSWSADPGPRILSAEPGLRIPV